MLIEKGYTVKEFEPYHRCGYDGEIDVYGVKGKYVVLFEIKGTDSSRGYKKATDQLERAKNCCFKGYRVFKFYAYSDRDQIKYEWIRCGK